MTRYSDIDPNPRERFDADPEAKPCRACGEWYEDCACATFNPASGRIAALAMMEQEQAR